MDVTEETPVFLVEDDTKLAGLIKIYLERYHFIVTLEHDGSRAVSPIMDENPALVILDIMLPGKDGRAICRELRGRYDGPIVMLTALDEEVDEIAGLKLGGDKRWMRKEQRADRFSFCLCASMPCSFHFGPWTLDFGPWTLDLEPWTDRI